MCKPPESRERHVAYLAIHEGKRYAYCCCGWKGDKHSTAVKALKERDQHLAEHGTDWWSAQRGRTDVR